MDTMGGVCHAEASSAFGVNPLSDVARPAGRRAPSLWSSPTLCPQGDHKVSRLHRTSPRHGSPFLRRPPSASAHLFLSSGGHPHFAQGSPVPAARSRSLPGFISSLGTARTSVLTSREQHGQVLRVKDLELGTRTRTGRAGPLRALRTAQLAAPQPQRFRRGETGGAAKAAALGAHMGTAHSRGGAATVCLRVARAPLPPETAPRLPAAPGAGAGRAGRWAQRRMRRPGPVPVLCQTRSGAGKPLRRSYWRRREAGTLLPFSLRIPRSQTRLSRLPHGQPPKQSL